MGTRISAVIFDLDGTLYRGKKTIDGAPDCIKTLRNKGVGIFFLSNASTNSRRQMAAKLGRMGIGAKPEEIYSSAYGAGRHILEKYGKGSGFYAVAESEVIKEMEENGLRFDDKKPRAVVVALDRGVTYEKIAKAYILIKKGAEFIATNKDPDYPVEKGNMPGAGAIVGAVEAATGQRSTLIGKPAARLISWLIKDHGLKKSRIALVGDSIDTDIMLAKKTGLISVLVLTGISTKKDIKKSRLKPDIVAASVKDLPSLLL